MQTKKTKIWKKILYEDQGFPDNYTDKCFLWDLKRNVKLQKIETANALRHATKVTDEVSTVTLFIEIYIYLFNDWLPQDVIFNMSNLLTLMGFIYYRRTCVEGPRLKLGHHVRTLLIFFVFGQLFAPILHTLTDTISTNTIYTTAFLMLFVHLIFFNYNAPIIVANSLSLSAAMFAAICLASRLASPQQAFILITIAIKLFILFPLLRDKSKCCLFYSILLVGTNIAVLLNVSYSLSFAYVCTVVVISIVCPLLYIRCQSYKDNIYGPWDEAIVEDADNINDLLRKKDV